MTWTMMINKIKIAKKMRFQKMLPQLLKQEKNPQKRQSMMKKKMLTQLLLTITSKI
jgi:DNA topoisomerase IB